MKTPDDPLNDEYEERGAEAPAAWSAELLRIHYEAEFKGFMNQGQACSEGFLQRCERTLAMARQMPQLREACRTMGGKAIGITAFLTRLAHQVSLDPQVLVGSVRIEPGRERHWTSSWARLARRIGLPIRDAEVMHEISYIENASTGMQGAMARASHEVSPFPEPEPGRSEELARLQALLCQVYEEVDTDDPS